MILYNFNNIELHQANSLDLPIENETIDCVVTSPPYWGLRDYGTEKWVGGVNDCDHLQVNDVRKNVKQTTSVGTTKLGFKRTCQKCGAKRIDAQIGLEETPEEYVKTMVNVFKEVWRVLKPTGTVWLNLGDSYSSGNRTSTTNDTIRGGSDYGVTRPKPNKNIKPKDLIGIPWRVAFALQSDGWYLRSDIIWHKPNPMPESVKDRPTKSHEYIFLLTKSPKYYYDSSAIKEEAVGERWSKNKPINVDNTKDKNNQFKGLTRPRKMLFKYRNKRDVWSVTTKPYKEAHFATFPEKLIEPCILAGCPEKICIECETPYIRQTKTEQNPTTEETSIFKKQCDCKTNETKSGIVLDPFVGAGTTMIVAQKHRRKAIGIDLKKEYLEIAIKRIKNDNQPLLI